MDQHFKLQSLSLVMGGIYSFVQIHGVLSSPLDGLLLFPMIFGLTHSNISFSMNKKGLCGHI